MDCLVDYELALGFLKQVPLLERRAKSGMMTKSLRLSFVQAFGYISCKLLGKFYLALMGLASFVPFVLLRGAFAHVLPMFYSSRKNTTKACAMCCVMSVSCAVCC